MQGHGLSTGMQDADHAGLCTQPFWIMPKLLSTLQAVMNRRDKKYTNYLQRYKMITINKGVALRKTFVDCMVLAF